MYETFVNVFVFAECVKTGWRAHANNFFISGLMVIIQEKLELCIFNWYGERLHIQKHIFRKY